MSHCPMTLRIYNVRFLLAAVILAFPLAGCSGMVPSLKEIKKDVQTNRTAQLMRMGDTTRKGGDLRAALLLYQQAHRMAPEEKRPLIAFARTTFALGLYKDAVNAYAKAAKTWPKDGAIRRGYGKALIAIGRPGKATEQYVAAIALDEKDTEAMNGLGVTLDLLLEHQEARKNYRAGINIQPDNLSLRNNLAISLALSGTYDEAIGILTIVARDPAAVVRYRLNLALVYGLAGDDAKAAETARLDLNESAVQNNLAYYKKLRAMTPEDRAKAILGRKK